MIDLEAKVGRKLAVWFEGEPELLQRMGNLARKLLYERIAGPNVDADGKPLPPLSRRRRWWTTPDDPRVGQLPDLRYYRVRDHRILESAQSPDGATVVATFGGGYGALKQRRTGSDKRGASLTGAMWAGLKLTISRKAGGDKELKLTFTGSQRVGTDATKLTKKGKPRTVSVTNATKARLLQHSKRGPDGKVPPGSTPDFRLMQLSASEMDQLRDLMADRLRLTKPAD